MKHINITNWQGNITDWTKFNYIYGGLDDTLADRVNLRIPGTNLRNYIKKSDNLYNIGTYNGSAKGVSINVSNQTLTLDGTSTDGFWINRDELSITLEAGTYTVQWFTNYNDNNIGFGLRNSSSGLDSLYKLNSQRYKTFTINETTTFTTAIWVGSRGLTFDNVKVSCMVYKGNYKAYTTFEPYGSMVMVENVGRLLGSTYKNDIITATTLGGLKCVVIQTDKDLIRDNFRTITAKNNLNLTNVSANVQWSSTQVNVLACNNSQRILINFDQSLTEEEMIEKAKTLVLDYKLITPKVTVFGQLAE